MLRQMLLTALKCLSALTLILTLHVHGVEANKVSKYKLWDGSEPMSVYAKDNNLPLTQKLKLGKDGDIIDLVLIPAGKFTMGCTAPSAPSHPASDGTEIFYSGILLSFCVIAWVLYVSYSTRSRPKVSLRLLIGFFLIQGAAILGMVKFKLAQRDWVKFELEKARFAMSQPQERPAHEVILTVPFYMSKYPITQQQFFAVTGVCPSHFNGRNLPVESISWNDAEAFCKDLTIRTSQIIRLPTEAEWEFGCRAGTNTIFFSGDSEYDLKEIAWYSANSGASTHIVGQKPPNFFGLCDMHGNVWEWCQDWYAPYSSEPLVDPVGPAQGKLHVLRGGAWCFNQKNCRSTYRGWSTSDCKFNYFGFRIVKPILLSD